MSRGGGAFSDRRSGWLCNAAQPIFQTARHSERIDKVRAAFSPFAKQPFRPQARLASRRIPGRVRGEGVRETPPAAILLFVQPPSAVTLALIARRHPPSCPIGAFNRQQLANVEKRINP